MRSQNYADTQNLPQFRLFGLVSAGRAVSAFQFETAAFAAHLRFYLRLLRQAHDERFGVDAVRVTVTDWTGRHTIPLQAMFAEIRDAFPNVSLSFDPEREHARTYFEGLAFHLYATNAAGEEAFLADGGADDWTQQFLSDRKERLLISGFGTERFVTGFANPAVT